MSTSSCSFDPREFNGKRDLVHGGTKRGEAIFASDRASGITGSEYVIDGWTIPTV